MAPPKAKNDSKGAVDVVPAVTDSLMDVGADTEG